MPDSRCRIQWSWGPQVLCTTLIVCAHFSFNSLPPSLTLPIYSLSLPPTLSSLCVLSSWPLPTFLQLLSLPSPNSVYARHRALSLRARVWCRAIENR